MREGEILADDTPDALRTGTRSQTVEGAFLHLVDQAAGRTAGPAGTATTAGTGDRKENAR